MAHKPDDWHRRSVRLRGYDYAQEGAYFVTICALGHECVFGKVTGDGMRLSQCGAIALEEWTLSAAIRPGVTLDAFVVMPNHVHGIIVLSAARMEGPSPMPPASPVGAHCVRPLAPSPGVPGARSAPRRPPASLPSLVAGYKAAVTARVRTLRGAPRQPLWQRGFYEHIIRDDDDLCSHREYIGSNPAKWAEDRLNPANSPGACHLRGGR